jgi:hypothetical protein
MVWWVAQLCWEQGALLWLVLACVLALVMELAWRFLSWLSCPLTPKTLSLHAVHASLPGWHWG